MTPSRDTLEELARWWLGVASDEDQIAAQQRRTRPTVATLPCEHRAMVWRRCAQQLELVLAGKPFNPDL